MKIVLKIILLKWEIVNKKIRVRLVKKDLSSVKNELTFKLKWIDFHHVCNLFLVDNDRSISKHKNIQDKKHFVNFPVLLREMFHMTLNNLFRILKVIF